MADDNPLCCCEYYSIKNQRTHLLTFCCECDELDKAVDDWLKGNPQTLEKLTAIIDVFSDRCRIPWLGGARQFDCGIVFPPLILFFSAYIACVHFVLTLLVFLGLPVVILCCYVVTIKVKMRTQFFLSLSLSSTVGCLLVYFYHVASTIPFHVNVFFVTTVIAMVVCFSLLRRKSNAHQFSLLKTNCLENTKVNFEKSLLSTSCEDCSHGIPPRAKHCRIDCCIGHHNHKAFLFTVFLYLVNIVTGCYISLSFACQWEIGLIPDCSHVYNSDSSLVFVVCCYATICGAALFILLTQQLILISFNITSYEWRHMQTQQSWWNTVKSSPYNKGIVKNWTEFLRV